MILIIRMKIIVFMPMLIILTLDVLIQYRIDDE